MAARGSFKNINTDTNFDSVRDGHVSFAAHKAKKDKESCRGHRQSWVTLDPSASVY